MSDDKKQNQGALPGASTPRAPEAPPKIIAPLTPDRLAQFEFSVAQYRAYVPSGLQPEDLLTVAFWTHFGGLFQDARKHGEVFVVAIAEDRKWLARYWVIDAGVNWAKVALLDKSEIEPVTLERRIMLLPGHSVANAGVFAKWRVVRDADQKVLRDKFETEGDAYAWLSEYAKSVAA